MTHAQQVEVICTISGSES